MCRMLSMRDEGVGINSLKHDMWPSLPISIKEKTEVS